MKASEHAPDQKASGVGRYWCHVGYTDPEIYQHGPFDTEEEATAEALHLMAEDDRRSAVVGVGEEIDLVIPDAEDVFERIGCNLNDQCGSEAGSDYLDHHQVSVEQRDELTAAIEKTVAEWLTKHRLWPEFVGIQQVKELTAGARLHGGQEGRA